MSRLAGAVLLAGVTLAVASFPAWAQGRLAIEWDRDRLTVDAEAMPLASVLDAVAGRTGVAIEGAEVRGGSGRAAAAGASAGAAPASVAHRGRSGTAARGLSVARRSAAGGSLPVSATP